MARFLGLALVTLALSGCGDPAADFAGTWTYTTGEVVVTCPGQAVQHVPLTGGQITIVEVNHTRFQATDSTGCVVVYDVNGATGTLTATTCSSPGGPGVQSLNTGTVTLANSTLTSAVSGTLAPTGAPAGFTCTLTVNGTLTRS